ncbi:acetate kinase, partial [Salmonella enterica subsp. enterica serovar Typhimurium]|nr:acetate kinase [Salmonella enterica subsp. enterica serovar Typhimurium]
AMAACIGGLDLIAFSGGIGEHDATLRADVCAALGWMGVRVDGARNAAATGDAVQRIDSDDSGIEVWVVPTDEGRVAAQA